MKDKKKKKMIGRYRILEEIGRGGMGTVYKGIQPSLHRIVAIKVLPQFFSSDREMLGRFLRESQSIASLNHPNIIQIIDQGEDEGTYYFVMEYMEGPALDVLLEKGPLPLPMVLDIISQICAALEFAHGKGIVHRDIKPSNILFSPNRKVVKIADFGIARVSQPGGEDHTLTREQKSLGSVNYMSPEQRLDAGKVDRRTDIYSLGVLFYQMLTGRLPLGSFRLPSHFDRRIPPQLDRIILSCLRSSPEERYPDVRALLNDLDVEKIKVMHLRGEVKNLFPGLWKIIRSAPGKIFREKSPVYIIGTLAVFVLAGFFIWFVARRPGETAGKLFPRTSPSLQNRFDYVETLLQGGMTEKAIKELEGVIDDYPDSTRAAEAQFKIGWIKESAGDYDGAEADYLKVMKLFRKSRRAPEAAFRIALIAQDKLKDESRAVNSLRKVYENYPDSPFAPRALLKLAQLQKYLGRSFMEKLFGGERKSSFQMAAQTLKRLVENYPQSEEASAALIELGKLYGPDHLKQLQESNRYYQILQEKYSRTDYPVLFHMARNFEELGEKNTAQRFYREFLDTNPGGEEADIARKKIREK